MMTLEEFTKAQKHNAEIINNMCETGKFTGFEEIQFWEKPETKLSIDVFIKNGFDILGCCAIGAIPSLKATGADGYAYFNNISEAQEIETKVSTIDSNYVFKGPRGGIQVRTPGCNSYPTGITSALSGQFNPYISEHTLNTKARYTSLICFDRKYNKFIDAWMMSPSAVATELKGKKSLSLTLANFENTGWRVNTQVDMIGWDEWKQQI
jgi:hypothetical protein